MATDIEIFIGTSQDFLLSFKVKKTDEDKYVLERFIAYRCHNGQIICMDTCGRYLATGGGDDKIVVIDLKLNRDVHEIIRHEGSINSLSFTSKGSDLLSGSEDGRLVATTVGSWKPANIWKKPHTGKAVLKVCLHQSDKFTMTLGKDGTLRAWDMLKGTQLSTYNTRDLSDAKIILDDIELCPNGNTFAMSGEKTVAIYSLSLGEPYDDLTLKSRVTSMCWLDDENLLIGMENGSIEWLNINNSEHVNLPNIHTRRVKGMHHLNGFLGTICSTGNVSLWTTTISQKKLTLVCTAINESVRPTCIKLIDTTENRYKEDANIQAVDSKDIIPPNSVKRSRPMSTTGKLIVEEDGSKSKEIALTNENWKLEITDGDTDTEIVITPEKKTPKKKRSKSFDAVVPTFTPATTPSSKRKTAKVTATKSTEFTSKSLIAVVPTSAPATPKLSKQKTAAKVAGTKSTEFTPETKKQTLKRSKSLSAVVPTFAPASPASSKRKTTKITATKPIVVRPLNSDDDFEKRPTKKRMSTGETVVKTEQPATQAKLLRKSNPKKKPNNSPNFSNTDIPNKLNASLNGGTPIFKKDTQNQNVPVSCPAVVKQTELSQSSTKKRRKLDFSKPDPLPTHLMATRNSRKKTM